VLDISLGVLVLILLATVVTMHYYQPDLSRILSFRFDKGEEIDVNNPPLELSFEVKNTFIEKTESVAVNLNFRNNYEKDIKSVKLNFEPLVSGLSVDRIELVEGEDIELKGKDIFVSMIPEYGAKDMGVKVYFNVYNKDQKVVRWKLNMEYVVRGQVIKESFTLNNINIASELNVTSVAYYNSPQGDQLGAGPLPPIAYLPTNYWVFWNTQGNGDFDNFVMSAQLPLGIELTESESLLAGSLNYNASSRKIIWRVSKLDSGNGKYRAGFEVQLIPEEEHIGKVVNLLTNTKYHADDSLGKKSVEGVINNLTTNLDFDKINKGQGVVLDQ